MPGRKASEASRREQILRSAHHVALRRGIDGLTVRGVAARAGLSHGLVLFHFKRKDQLVGALLDRVLATTISLHVAEDIARIKDPGERLRTLLMQETDRLSRDTRQIRLFLEYWALGTRKPAIREKISAELERYRAAFRTVTEEVMRTDPGRFDGLKPAALAAIAVSFINGCAVQATMDPDHFDIGEYMAAVRGIIGRLAITAHAAGPE
jgi:TetR/AcrR family transcriptional regulator, transcriptional repressor of bet genes